MPMPGPRGGPPPAPGQPYPFEQITPAGESWAEQMDIWVTPWGFLRGAAANAATVRSRKIEGVTYSVVTWSPAQKAPSGQPYRVIGYINPQQFIDRVETWIEHPVFGDMHVETFYSDYADFGGGLRAPTRIAAEPRRHGDVRRSRPRGRANPSTWRQLMTPTRRRRAGRSSSGRAGRLGKAGRRRVPHHRRLRVSRRRVQGSRRRARRRGERSARTGRHRRNKAAVSEQTDQVRRQHAPALRSRQRAGDVRRPTGPSSSPTTTASTSSSSPCCSPRTLSVTRWRSRRRSRKSKA